MYDFRAFYGERMEGMVWNKARKQISDAVRRVLPSV